MPRHAELRPRKLSSGVWRVDVAPSLSLTGKRLKKDFETEARAKTYIVGLKSLRAQPISDTEEQRREAYLQRSRLPEGKSLTEAVDLALSFWQREVTGRTFGAVLEQVLAAKRSSGVSQRHLRDIKEKAGRFAQEFGGQTITSIERSDIRKWLAELRSIEGRKEGEVILGGVLSPESRNCYRRVLSIVFSFAHKEEYIAQNPIAAVEPAKSIPSPVEIFSPAESSCLLAAAAAHRFDENGRKTTLSSILPAMAIGLFAGLRPEETLRLAWSDIDWTRRTIEVAADRTKTAQHRFVPVNDTLAAWLGPYRQSEGRVSPVSLFRTQAKIRRQAGILRWPQDVLRHSYASYSLALDPDVARLAAVMGNSVEVIHDHYRRPVRQDDAKAFFAILP